MTGPEATDSHAPAAATAHTDAKTLLSQLGGVSGIVYSSLPVLIFALISTVAGLLAAVASALGVALLILLWRLLRRDSVQPAFAGFFGVGVCALIALVAGESRGYFLLGIWTSLWWAVVFTVSVLIRRPAVGYLWSWTTKRDRSWRGLRRARFAFDVATLAWALVFAARFVVQRLLYEAHETGWLGVARLAMGWPLTAVAAIVTYLVIRTAQRAMAADLLSAPDATVDAAPPPPR